MIQDLRFAFRTLFKKPGPSTVAVLILALGIGANVTMASLTSALFFRPLPYADEDQVAFLWRETPRDDRSPFSIPTFRDWKERNQAFESLAMYHGISKNLTHRDGEPSRVQALMVTAELPAALGIRPILGRSFTAADDRREAERTVMLGYELWQNGFGRSEDLIGQTVSLDGEAYTVIGILPPELGRETLDGQSLGDLWLPMEPFFAQLPTEERAARQFLGVGRLAPGVSVEAAQEDLDRVMAGLYEEHPEAYEGNRLRCETIRESLVGSLRPVMLVLLATVGCVLLIACVNLTHLLLTRAADRRKELATRRAIGAGRRQIVGQLVTESLVLALVGGVGALLAGQVCLRLLKPVLAGVRYADAARIDASVVVLTVALSLVSALVIGILPAVQVTRLDDRRGAASRSGSPLHRGSLPQQRLRQTLVVVEIALTLILLVAAGLLLASLARLSRQDPGFRADDLLTLQITLPQAAFDQRVGWLSYFEQALERVGALPGVEAVAATSWRPLDGSSFRSIIAAGDRELPPVPEMATAGFQMVSPGYFRSLGVPLLEGRDFTADDDDRKGAERVVVIDESLAGHFWPGESPVGRTLAFEFAGSPADPQPQYRRIVGVVGDVRAQKLGEASGFAVYAPVTQIPLWFEGGSPTMSLMIRSRRSPSDLVPVVRSVLLEVDRHQPVHGVRMMSDIVADQLDSTRLATVLLSSFAGLATLLSMVGIYGVIAFSVACRTREIATRMAFGARPGQILTGVLRSGLVTVAVGIALGLVGAASLTHLMSSLLYGLEALDPGVFTAGVALLTLVATAAMVVPAWRGTRVQPAQALRSE